MKSLLYKAGFAAIICLGTTNLKAQSATEATAEIFKTAQPVYTIELNHSPDVVEEALYRDFKSQVDKKGDESKNIRAYKGVILSQVSPDKMDYYTRVERKSKKEKDKSVVYLWVSMGNENFVSSSTNPTVAQNALVYLNNFMNSTAIYQHTLNTQAQEDAVAKAQKKVNSAKDDIADYEKKIADYQKKLEAAKKELVDREAELNNEKQKLEALKAKG